MNVSNRKQMSYGVNCRAGLVGSRENGSEQVLIKYLMELQVKSRKFPQSPDH